MNKQQKAKEFVKSRNVIKINEWAYEVIGFKEKYNVYYTALKKTCTCRYFSIHVKECSHIIAVKMFKGE